MDFTILHFAIHIVWRANVICTYRKSGIARKTTVAYPELRLIRYSNAVSIAISRRRYPNANPSPPICRGIIQLSIFSTNTFLAIILLQVTPTAKRNSYRVAILVGALPRVAGHARYPGLCNRNSYRVAGGAYQPIEAPSQPSPGRALKKSPIPYK